MKTGGTSGKKNFVFTFHSVCTVFVPFKIEYFQSILTVWYLHNYKRVPYEDFHIFAVMDSASIFSGNERIEVLDYTFFFLIFVSQKQLVNVLITEKKKNDNGNVQKRSTTHTNGAH